jgi:hypothetical protein
VCRIFVTQLESVYAARDTSFAIPDTSILDGLILDGMQVRGADLGIQAIVDVFIVNVVAAVRASPGVVVTAVC